MITNFSLKTLKIEEKHSKFRDLWSITQIIYLFLYHRSQKFLEKSSKIKNTQTARFFKANFKCQNQL